MSPLLSATALSIGRGDRTLLSDLDLSVSAGDVLHLRGPNGVGKSSLIEVLAGLRPALKGEIRRERPMHWIGHRNALQGDLSVAENLAYWCAINEAGTTSLTSAMDRLGLSRLKSRPARMLSAGQKRRTALCRLLVVPRPLWLLDEPMSGLDAAGTILLGQLMNEHVGTGQGAILVTSHQALPGRLPRVTVLELA